MTSTTATPLEPDFMRNLVFTVLLVLLTPITLSCAKPLPDVGNDDTGGRTNDDGSSPAPTGTSTPDVSTSAPPGTSAADSGAVDSGTTGLKPETTTMLDGPRPDLPLDPTCALEPSSGASIQLGDPAEFGGLCPSNMAIWTRVVTNNGAEVELETCNEACLSCNAPVHPLSVSPLVIGDVLPESTCLRLEATTLLETDDRCHWGALTIHDPVLLTPYVIATARSSTPTPTGADMLGEAIPDPVHALDCECAALGQVGECCDEGGLPSFWTYTIDSIDVYPGDETPIELVTIGLDHVFHLFQAERIPGCRNDTLQLSWAVVAEP